MKPSRFGRLVPYAVAALLAIELPVLWWLYPGEADAYSQSWALARALGWQAFGALCVALCVTPIARLAARFTQARSGWSRELRRGLGLLAATTGLVHAAIAWRAIPAVRAGLFESAQLRAGVAALAILCLLYLTSFRSLVRRLSLGFWKELHRLAYVAFALVALHALFGAFTPLRTVLWLAGCTLLIGLLRLLPRKRAAQSWPL